MADFKTTISNVLVNVSQFPYYNNGYTPKNLLVKYVSFHDIQIQAMTSNFTNSSSSVMNMMYGKNAFLGILKESKPNFGKNSSCFKGVQTFYNNLSTGVITARGTVVTQPINAGMLYSGVKNGLYYSSTKQNDGLIWSATPLSTVSNIDNKINSSISIYGTVQQQLYICNEGGYNSIFPDHNGYASRTYTLSKANINSYGSGSFVLCYNIGKYSTFNRSTGSSIYPMLECNIGVSKILSGVASSSFILMKIPANGQITTLYQSNSIPCRLSTPHNQQKLPPHCKKVGQTLSLKPLYIYPTYYGVVIANSIATLTKNEIFIKFQNNSDIKFNLQLKNMANDAKQISNLDTRRGDFTWFPTTFNQSGSSACSLKVRQVQDMIFNGDIKLKWHACLGKFAYSPLYFYKDLKTVFIFKGTYISSGVYGDYYLYPIVTVNRQVNTSQYSGIFDEQGYAKPITLNANSKYVDSTTQEVCYYTNVNFIGSQCQRYPLQYHGVIIATTLSGIDNVFKIQKTNGNFSMLLSQVVGYSDTTVTSSFINFATNISIQAGLDGLYWKCFIRWLLRWSII